MNLELLNKRWPVKCETNIQVYTFNTPNGVKIPIALEEMQLPYECHKVDITQGDQFSEAFLSISPNNKIPAIVDPDGPEGSPISVMESGAILYFLAEKSGQLLPRSPSKKIACLEWLFFQIGSVGPMFGQFGHFYKFAKETCKDPYPIDRYRKEVIRLLCVIEKQLNQHEYIAGPSYTIADIAIFPWVNTLQGFYEAGEVLQTDQYTALQTWLNRCMNREASKRAYRVLDSL